MATTTANAKHEGKAAAVNFMAGGSQKDVSSRQKLKVVAFNGEQMTPNCSVSILYDFITLQHYSDLIHHSLSCLYYLLIYLCGRHDERR